MKYKREKLSSAIREAAGDYISRERFTEAMVTVTSVSLNKDMSKATISVTVYPESKEKKISDKLNRGKGAFAKYIKDHTRLSLIPYFSFNIDEGEKYRQHLDDISP
ncbi:MAG: ribosome-binding factor A [Candidatus Paceibacterota bacterium]